jgi:hypothetical protein
MWFGLFGAPAAWVAQFLLGFGSTQAQCNPAGARWGVPVHTLTIAATAAAATIALLGWLAAIAVTRSTRGAESAPPRGRVHFLAVVGMTTSPLFFLIIVWSGVGALVLQECHQG